MSRKKDDVERAKIPMRRKGLGPLRGGRGGGDGGGRGEVDENAILGY